MATSILVRDVPEAVAAGLRERAAAAGMSMEAWLRAQLSALAAGPVVRQTYALRAFEPSTGATLQIGRYPGASVEIIKQHHLSAAQRGCCDAILNLMRRNEPGDREAAMHLLSEHFEQIFDGHV